MYFYVISFNDIVNHDFPNARNISSVHEGENDIHSFEVSHLVSGLDHIWPIYKLESGTARVGDEIVLEAQDYTNDYINVPLPDCLLLESGRLKIQIVGTDSAEDIDTIFDTYASGEFNGRIAKSDVYEFYVMDSLDPMEELIGPGGISQAAKEYLTDLVDELIAEGIHIDTALSTTSVNAVENRVVTNAINGKANKANPVILGCISQNRAEGSTVGSYSDALGNGNTAAGEASVAMGTDTKALSANQVVEGKCNVADSYGTYAHIVGNGTGDAARSNAATLDWQGNAWFAGTVKVGSSEKELATKEYVDGKSPFADVQIIFPNTPQSGTYTGSIAGSVLSTAINNGKIPLFTLRYDIEPSDPTEPTIMVRRVCQCLILNKDNHTATVMYDYNGTTYLVTIAWINSLSTNYTLTLNALATAADISNAIGGSY